MFAQIAHRKNGQEDSEDVGEVQSRGFQLERTGQQPTLQNAPGKNLIGGLEGGEKLAEIWR